MPPDHPQTPGLSSCRTTPQYYCRSWFPVPLCPVTAASTPKGPGGPLYAWVQNYIHSEHVFRAGRKRRVPGSKARISSGPPNRRIVKRIFRAGPQTAECEHAAGTCMRSRHKNCAITNYAIQIVKGGTGASNRHRDRVGLPCGAARIGSRTTWYGGRTRARRLCR